MQSGGTKHDHGKPMMSLIDSEFLTETALVLTFGAVKYDVDNWRKGIPVRRLLDATLRHVNAINAGEDADPETGLHHAAHAACELMFAMWMIRHRPDLDDRWHHPATHEGNHHNAQEKIGGTAPTAMAQEGHHPAGD